MSPVKKMDSIHWMLKEKLRYHVNDSKLTQSVLSITIFIYVFIYSMPWGSLNNMAIFEWTWVSNSFILFHFSCITRSNPLNIIPSIILWPVRFMFEPHGRFWPPEAGSIDLTSVTLSRSWTPKSPRSPIKEEPFCSLFAHAIHIWQTVYDDIWGSDGSLALRMDRLRVPSADGLKSRSARAHTHTPLPPLQESTHIQLVSTDYSALGANNLDIRELAAHKCAPCGT